MFKKNKFAIVGLGMISKYFIKALSKNKRAKLAALCDIDRNKLFNYKHKPKIKLYNTLEQVLGDTEVNSVVVAAPNYTHYKIVKDCLLANKNVLCEKPLGINPREVKLLIDLADSRKLLLRTAFHRSYNKNLLNSLEKKASIKAIHCRYLENIREHSDDKNNWYKLAGRSGGGCVIDNGINVFNVLYNLVGDLKYESAHIGYRKDGRFFYDENACILLKFGKNNYCSIELDWNYAGEVKDLTVYYSDGSSEYVNFLDGFNEFKGSLWHEYENLTSDFILGLASGYTDKDITSLKASKLVDEIYKKAN
jgi:predicted dehydrogenase